MNISRLEKKDALRSYLLSFALLRERNALIAKTRLFTKLSHHIAIVTHLFARKLRV